MAREKTTGKGPSQDFAPLGAALGPQMKQFWESQERILSETESFARSWFARRHAATQAALEACEKAAEANPTDAPAALQALRDWQAHSAERIAEDMREWVELWSRCAGYVVKAEVDAGSEALEEVERQTKGDLGKRYATPV